MKIINFLKKNAILFLILFLSLVIYSKVNAQTNDVENEFNTWISTDLKYKFSKKIQLTVTPELRLENDFEWNKFLLESKLRYKVFKYLDVSGGYRFTIENSNSNDVSYFQRFFIDLGTSKKFNRFEAKFGIKYTNEAEFNTDNQYNYLRYKGGIEYNIPHHKITPFFSLEAFHSLDNKMVDKFRYHIGAAYKINKHNQIELGYKLDYYMTKYKNSHILGLSYRFKF